MLKDDINEGSIFTLALMILVSAILNYTLIKSLDFDCVLAPEPIHESACIWTKLDIPANTYLVACKEGWSPK